MFAPVVKAVAPRRRRPTASLRAAAPRSPRRRRAAPARSTWRSPTDLLARRGADARARPPPRGAAPARGDARRRGRAARRRRAAADVGRRRRARRRRAEVARAGRAARRAGPHDLRRAPACSRPAHPCLVGHAAARRARRPRCGTRPTSSSRSAPTSTASRPQNFAHAAAAARWSRSTSTPRTRRRTTASTCCSQATPRAAAALAERLAPRDGLDARASACTRCAREACAALDAARAALPRRDALRAARRRRRRRRHVHPRLLARRLLHAGGAAPAADPARLGHARLRVPGGARRRARRRPGRWSRSPATAASCSRAASWRRWRRSGIPLTAVIVDDGGYGMLRYDQDVAGASATASTCARPTSRRWRRAFGIRAETVDGLDDEFGEALAAHVARARRRACSWRARPSRSCRRRTPRRTGTAGDDRPRAGAAFRLAAHNLHERLPAGERGARGRGHRPAGHPARPGAASRSRRAVADADARRAGDRLRRSAAAAVAVAPDDVAVFTTGLAPPDEAAARTLVGDAVDALDPAGSARSTRWTASARGRRCARGRPARARRLPPGAARAAAGRAAVVVPRLPEPSRAPVAVAGDRRARRAGRRRAATGA